MNVVKRLLKKAVYANEDFWIGLLNYKTAPLKGGKVPCELLMGRRSRRRLPDFGDHKAPDVKKHTQTHYKNWVNVTPSGCSTGLDGTRKPFAYAWSARKIGLSFVVIGNICSKTIKTSNSHCKPFLTEDSANVCTSLPGDVGPQDSQGDWSPTSEVPVPVVQTAQGHPVPGQQSPLANIYAELGNETAHSPHI